MKKMIYKCKSFIVFLSTFIFLQSFFSLIEATEEKNNHFKNNTVENSADPNELDHLFLNEFFIAQGYSTSYAKIFERTPSVRTPSRGVDSGLDKANQKYILNAKSNRESELRKFLALKTSKIQIKSIDIKSLHLNLIYIYGKYFN